MNNIFSSISSFTHNLVETVVKSGDHVIDATIGNGNDTLFLAQKVGVNGKVYGFDIQKIAIENTTLLLNSQGLLAQTNLIHTGHENMKKYVTTSVKAVMFNLGYLPKGDHEIITLPQTTISALGQALDLLLPKGIITVTVYTGHEGGKNEEKAVNAFLKELDKKHWDVLKWSFVNRNQNAPYLIIIYRRGGLDIENKTS
ncbi:MAG: class I SAM-dependent methyltransferase [Peptococcales bacterium]|jgi:SAM-dependent methyltransferase